MNYTAEDFHLQYISTYNLYVQSDLIYDHLLVMDQDKQVLVYMKYDNLAPSPEATRLLSLPFAKVYISLPHQHLVWVPSEVYEATDKSIYLDYFEDSNLDNILSKEIAFVGATALYQMDLFLLNRWKKLFPEANFIPNFELVLKQASNEITSVGQTLGFHLYDNQADIYLFQDGEMRIYNTFEVETEDDLSYFLLNIYRNFDIKEKVDKILLSGSNRDSQISKRLANYGNTLVLLDSNEKWIVTDEAVLENLESLNILKDSALCV